MSTTAGTTAGDPARRGQGQRSDSVWSIARRHRPLLMLGVLLGLIGVAASLAQPYAIGELIGAAGLNESLTWSIILLAVLFCADAGFSALQAYTIGRAGENIVLDVRQFLAGRLLRSDLAEYNKLQQGDVLTRSVTDTALVKIALSQSLAQLVINGLTVIGCLALMAWINIWLLLITVGCLGVASLVSIGLARRLRKVAVQNREDTGVFGADLHRVLSALPTVKASRAENRELVRLGALAGQARRSGVRTNALNALLIPAMNVGTQAALAVVVGVGMTRVAQGSMPLADLTAFVLYLFYLVSPLVLLFLAIGQFQQGRAAIQRVDELAGLAQEDSEGEAEDKGVPRPVAPTGSPGGGRAAVEFHGVRFAYEGGSEEQALDDVSFTVPANGLTAIVGPSGAGKTTLFQLIERFYKVDDGTILLRGRNIAALPLETVRGLVGYVQQDSTAMRGTIRENLTYANPSATESDIREALEMAGLADAVRSMPRQLDTELGDQGSGLSGGQRQRLCIARTLLQKPAVMLLDEATSHLDSDTERDFRRALRRVSRHCTIIAIAHRISTVVDADKIVVMQDGKVRAMGTHQHLMEHDELYYRLAGSQLHAEPEPGGDASTPLPGQEAQRDVEDTSAVRADRVREPRTARETVA